MSIHITGLLAGLCPNGDDCPQIRDTDGDDVVFQGKKLTPELRAQLHLPADEDAVTGPRTLVQPQAMDLPTMGAYLRDLHTRHRLRIENRRAYASASDGGDFARYLAGEPEPEEGGAWHDRLRADTAAGKYWAKVHVVVGELSDYERYEFEWGFTRTTAAGEQVRIYEAQPGELDGLDDFTVIDDRHVVASIYNSNNQFVYGLPMSEVAARAMQVLASTLWERAIDFSTWWEAHHEAHRRPRAA
jgi:hypothetical protein